MAWERLGSASGGSSSISVTITAKEYLRVIFQQNTAVQCKIQFNDDANQKYCLRRSENSGNDASEINQTYMRNWNSGSATQRMVNMDIVNLSNEEKICNIETVENTSGASGIPNRMESVGKYTEKTGQITKVSFVALSGTIDSDATLTVFGASSTTVEDEKQTLADATKLADVTKTDDLSTDKGWVSNTSDWSYNATNDSIDLATIRRSTTSQEIYIDLQDSDYLGSGVNLSDSSFTVRFGKIKTNSMASSANISYSVMLSKGLQDSGTNQYSINLQHNPNSNESFVRARANSNTNNEGNSTHVQTFSSTYAPSESNTYRWEIVRDGNDFNCKVYAENDSSYSTPLETKTVTATGITDLRYILITNDSEQNHAQTADVEILGDIEVINQQSVSTAPNAGTQYRETDTRKIYRWKAESSVDATYTEDMSDTTGWSFADTGAINVTSGSLS